MTKKRGLTLLSIGMFLLAGLIGCTSAATTQTQQPTPVASAPREPKRLEAKTTIIMRDVFFTNEQGVRGGPFKLPAGKTVGIHIINKGAVEHEIMFGKEIKHEDQKDEEHGYAISLFEDTPVDAFVYPSEKKVEVATEGKLEEIELEPGADVWLRVTFPPNVKGTWEIGCFVPSHYEAGMKAVFVIE